MASLLSQPGIARSRRRPGWAALALAIGFTTTAGAGVASLSVADASVAEGNSGNTLLNFTVSRTGDLSSRVVIPYKVTPGTATAGTDYVAPAANAVLRLEPGVAQGTIGIPVRGDTAVEPDETLSLTLGKGSAYAARTGFQGRDVYPGGRTPGSTATGDFNGDGKPDLAVVNYYGDTVVVQLNKGDGSFSISNPPTYTVGVAPLAVAAGDFNGDGKLDLAVVSEGQGEEYDEGYEASSVAVLLNKGDGTFPRSETLRYPVGSYPRSIAVGDFNGDGRADLVTANSDSDGSGSVATMLFNSGNGRFPSASAPTYPVGQDSSQIIVSDVNGDGKPDLVSANPYNQNVAVLLNKGNGVFPSVGAPTYPTGISPGWIAAGDLDGDTRPDLAVVDSQANAVAVLRNQGGGVFASTTPPRYPVGRSPGSVTIGDINGDGRPDLATTNFKDATVSVLLNQGMGTFATTGTPTYPVGSGPTVATVTDFNGDGKPDLAVATLYRDITVLLNQGNGTFPTVATPTYPTGRTPLGVASGDFNGDGRPDLVTANSNSFDVSVLLNQGAGTFPTAGAPAYFVRGINSGPYAVAAADLNGDGKPDLATANYGSGAGEGSVSVLLNNGDGTFPTDTTPVYAVGGGPRSIAAGDFNGDGRTDLAVANAMGDTVTVLLNRGRGTFPTSGAPTYSVSPPGDDSASPLAIAVGDFNGDGKADIATANYDTDNVTVLLNQGNGTFPTTNAPAYAVGYGPTGLATGDFNGDGRLDLAAANYADATASILLNQGNGTFPTTNSLVYPVNKFPLSITTGDFDGDGRLDLAATGTASVQVLLNKGNNLFESADRSYSVGYTAYLIAAGDFDSDGKADLVTANTNGTVSVLLNEATASAGITQGTARGTIVNDDRTMDTTPDAFAFNPRSNAPRDMVISSEAVAITGIDGATPVSIGGGQYAIVRNGVQSSFTTEAGTLQPGDSVIVRLISSKDPGTTFSAKLVVGGVQGIFRVTTTPPDTTPDAFSFAPVTGAAAGSTISSRPVAITGIDAPSVVKVGGGKFAIVRNGALGAFTDGSATLQPGDSLVAQAVAPAAPGEQARVTIYVGSVAGTFTVTTFADTTPNPFGFTSATNVPKSSTARSNTVAISGIDGPSPISITGGTYAITKAGTTAMGSFTTAAGSIRPGDKVTLQQTSSATGSTTTVATLTIGGTSGTYSVTTRP